MVQETASQNAEQHAFVKKVHGIRYHVKDVAGSVAFYTHILDLHSSTINAPPSQASPSAPRACCSAVPARAERQSATSAAGRRCADP
jgi:hypothetical protein